MFRNIVAACLIFLQSLYPALAETRMVNSPGDGYLNLRQGPSSSYNIITEMYHGETVEVLRQSGSWLYVEYAQGIEGWAFARYLVPYSSRLSTLQINSPGDGFLNLRTGPGSRNPIIREMPHGSSVVVLGRSGNWLEVRHQSGSTGWAHSQYLDTSVSPRSVAGTSPRPSSPQSSSEGSDSLTGTVLFWGLGAAIVGCTIGSMLGASCLEGSSGPEPVYFTNDCPLDDVILEAVRYVDEDNEWRTRGSWRLEYGERVSLRYRGDRLRTQYDTIYYYAETEDGDVFWRGDHDIYFDGRELPMIGHQSSRSPIDIRLTCRN